MKRCQLPHAVGVGFKPEHFSSIIQKPQPVGFFEVHAENYMGEGGPPHARLGKLREDYALSIHGVGLSIGSMQPLDRDHLDRLKILCDRYEPESFSEHLAWSSHDTNFFNDLLPLPYTDKTLERVVAHIDQVQSFLDRRLLLENPATYLQFVETTMDETEFLSEIVKKTGCGLLLDINNVFVASTNHRTDPETYLANFPLSHVCEIHLGGHSGILDKGGAVLLIDSHDTPVKDPVWDLYTKVLGKTGAIPTLIEWDNDVPEWSVMLAEATMAERLLGNVAIARER